MYSTKILIPALAGTTAMTLFSYLVSASEKRNYREPEILGQLINRLPESGSEESSQLAGWGAHYAAGIGFTVLYDEVWKRTDIKPSVTSGALLGAASGLAGIVAWKASFEAHPNPPAKNLKKYFSHLMLAHVVFGVFTAMTYKLFVSDQDQHSKMTSQP